MLNRQPRRAVRVEILQLVWRHPLVLDPVTSRLEEGGRGFVVEQDFDVLVLVWDTGRPGSCISKQNDLNEHVEYRYTSSVPFYC